MGSHPVTLGTHWANQSRDTKSSPSNLQPHSRNHREDATPEVAGVSAAGSGSPRSAQAGTRKRRISGGGGDLTMTRTLPHARENRSPGDQK